ncbi:MAG: type II toxin-antitoxin system HipA family toxin [Candidatus Eisenbacteria bacterium]|nr:type II toxin-antitoxin system HipA family toxin [Candidatus Eisenbacteria bacterium]
MSRCPIAYEELAPGEGTYSRRGLQRLSRTLTHLDVLPYSAAELRHEAALRAAKMSIPGVQPKLSARLRVKQGRFEIADRGGTYILKPQHPQFPHLAENEDLTMHLAGQAGIEVPVHGLVASSDGTWTYFIKRFDRVGHGAKLAVEDFAQLAGHTRETKYDSSMEKVAGLLDRYATFPAVEKLELLRRTLFCFLTAGEDMHLKNFSLITRGRRVQFSPAYDLVNSAIVLRQPAEELALPIRGKKRNLSRRDLLESFGAERLSLTAAAIESVLQRLADVRPAWERFIEASFLPEPAKESYRALVEERWKRLGPAKAWR